MDKKRTKTFIKIVYFDESSSADLIYILSGGKTSGKEEKFVSKLTELSAGVEAKTGAGLRLIGLAAAKLGVEGDAGASRESSLILSKVVESTILTDYIRYSDEEARSYITVFSGYKLHASPYSFTHIKMIAPYLTMADGKLEIVRGLNIDPSRVDQALSSGRKYYELIAQQDTDKVVLRFNINAFRNNYSISDIVKMELDYHAIYVGSISEDSLHMQSEFDKNDEVLSGCEVVNPEMGSKKTTLLKVYDVILAGVCV